MSRAGTIPQSFTNAKYVADSNTVVEIAGRLTSRRTRCTSECLAPTSACGCTYLFQQLDTRSCLASSSHRRSAPASERSYPPCKRSTPALDAPAKHFTVLAPTKLLLTPHARGTPAIRPLPPVSSGIAAKKYSSSPATSRLGSRTAPIERSATPDPVASELRQAAVEVTSVPDS